jgi:hypothetical protein
MNKTENFYFGIYNCEINMELIIEREKQRGTEIKTEGIKLKTNVYYIK